MLSALTRRWPAIGVAVGVVAILVTGVVLYQHHVEQTRRSICAHLPDSAGLYAGNAVNIRGVRVGEVSAISPRAGYVRVTMTVDDRPLNAGVKVVAVNNSVLADRRLELVDATARGARDLGEQCVPLARSFTPISVSSAFGSFTKMFQQLAGPGTDSAAPVGDLLTTAARELDGTGRDINAIVENMSGLMADPDAFLAQLRSVFDNLAVLSDVADDNWDAITDIGLNASSLTHFMGALFKDFVYIFDGLGEAGPGLDNLLGDVLPPVLDLSDITKPMLDVALSHVDDLNTILKQLPGIATSLTTSINRRATGFALTYRAPKVLATTSNSAALCALMNRGRPGGCDPRSGRVAAVDLTAIVASAVQGGLR